MSSDLPEPDELDEVTGSDSADAGDYDPEEDQDTGATNTAPPGERPTDPPQS